MLLEASEVSNASKQSKCNGIARPQNQLEELAGTLADQLIMKQKWPSVKPTKVTSIVLMMSRRIYSLNEPTGMPSASILTVVGMPSSLADVTLPHITWLKMHETALKPRCFTRMRWCLFLMRNCSSDDIFRRLIMPVFQGFGGDGISARWNWHWPCDRRRRKWFFTLHGLRSADILI